jgi:hypothetical protein
MIFLGTAGRSLERGRIPSVRMTVVPGHEKSPIVGDVLDIQDRKVLDSVDAPRLWGEHYSRKSSEIIPLQEQIVGGVANKLQGKLSGEAIGKLLRKL